MSNLGGGEIFVVLLLALIVLGPERLPEAARKIGKFVHQVRSMSSGFQDEVRKAVDLGGDEPFSPDEARIKALPAATDGESATPVAEDLETDVRGYGEETAEQPGD